MGARRGISVVTGEKGKENDDQWTKFEIKVKIGNGASVGVTCKSLF